MILVSLFYFHTTSFIRHNFSYVNLLTLSLTSKIIDGHILLGDQVGIAARCRFNGQLAHFLLNFFILQQKSQSGITARWWLLLFFLKVWWHEATLYCFLHYLLYGVHSYKFIHTNSFITFAEFRSSFFITASSGWGSPLGCRAEIWSRGRLTAARHATNCAMPFGAL
jgi:hypothetical protein